MVKNKSFYEINADGSLAETGYVDIDAVIRYMKGMPKAAAPLVQKTQLLAESEPEKPVTAVGFSQEKPSDAARGRVMPPAKKLGSSNSSKPIRPSGHIIPRPTDNPGFAIPDKYKMKPKDS